MEKIMKQETEILINGSPIRLDMVGGRTKPMVACLGPAGTYTEAARHEMLGESLRKMDAIFLPQNGLVVQQVESGDLDIGIVPVENAIEGDVVEVLRELNHAKNITILGETILGIQHMLIGRPGESVDEIQSHPQALAQCRSFLLQHYTGIKQEPTPSTTAAVEIAKENKNVLAIASRRAAQIYDLPILEEDIGDIKGNSTRFLMLGRGETNTTGQDSTAMIFVAKEERFGILADCLAVLKRYRINLTKIDSRPTGFIRQYAFWVTMDGHVKDEPVKLAVDELKTTYASSLRVLGSYKKAEIPTGAKDPGVINGD